MRGPLAIDAAIGDLASGQRGVISLQQLRALGVPEDCIHRRVRSGLLIKLAPTVYRVAGAPRCWEQRAAAAALWVGDTGAVSGPTAAALHRLDGFGPPHVIDVHTTRPLRSRSRLIRVHVTPYWMECDRVTAAGLAVTSISRTLIDLAGISHGERVEIALEDALRRRLTTASTIAMRLADLPSNQRGRTVLTRMLEQRGASPPADSGLEVKVARMLREWGYPPPIRQKVLDDDGRFVGRVDLVFPNRRLVIEVDGFRHHDGRVVFDHDRARRNALVAMGWVVVHATSAMLVEPARSEFERDLARTYHRPL